MLLLSGHETIDLLCVYAVVFLHPSIPKVCETGLAYILSWVLTRPGYDSAADVWASG